LALPKERKCLRISFSRKEWANVLRVRNNGVPIVGFTWYSLTDQVDWDSGLCRNNGCVNPLGLYDLDRKIRAVGKAYRELIHAWMEVLPTQSVCLQVPIVTPRDYEDGCGERERAWIESADTATTCAPKNTE
jgi:hypothetical protein